MKGIESYLQDLITKVETSNQNFDENVVKEVKKLLLSFESKKISQIITFGSSIKATNIRQVPRIKLLVSVKEKDKRPIDEITQWFFNYLQFPEWQATKKYNQLEFTYKNVEFNIYFAKKKLKSFNFHIMENIKLNKEIISNFNIHTTDVIESKFQKEIILIKLWREKHNLNFPTIYLELVVISVLRKFPKTNLFSRVIRILDYLRKDFLVDKFYDPSNTHNVISDYLNKDEKKKIQDMAKISLSEQYVSDMVS